MVMERLQTAGWFRNYKVRVPRNPSAVLSIDRESEQPPAAGGLSDAAVGDIWQAVEALYLSGAYPAVGFCLRRHGHVLLNRALGHAQGNGPEDLLELPKQRLTTETPICLFSASKAVTAILVHLLAEDGEIDLDQRLSHYVPEFARHGKRHTTVAEVLAHRGGVPTLDLRPEEARPELLTEWDRVIRMICQAPPKNSRQMAYHAITGGFILAEVIQRVTGKSVQAFLDQRLRRPLGMKHFTYGLPKRYRKQVALNYAAGQAVRFPLSQMLQRVLLVPIDDVIAISNTDTFMDAVVPAGNIYSTAEELSRFYQMLLNGGEYNGKQVMRPETVARAVQPSGRMSFDRTLMIPMRYSEGMMLGANPVGLYGPSTAQAYGHLGFMNILGWADPARDIACSLLVTGKALLGTHLIQLSALLNTISQRCR
jgi:CubicO group peptidase (beta-lactamase class C family)